MPLTAPTPKAGPPQGLTPEQVAALQDVRERANKAQSVGATILSNMTQAIRRVDEILGDES